MKWIFRSAVVFAVAAQLAACTSNPEPTYSNANGTLAISRDDALLFAVDEDSEIVAIIDLETEQKIDEVKVGTAPSRIIASKDNTLYVSNRGSRNVSVVKNVSGDWTEVQKIDVGVEPTGLALAPEEDILYVVNATSLESTEYGTLTAIDTKSNQVKWELPVGEEPRGIALTHGGTMAMITLFKRGDVVQVDLTTPQVVKAPLTDKTVILQKKQGLYYNANRTALDPQASSTTPTGGGFSFRAVSKFQPRSAADVVTTPDGKRAFVPVVWSREDAITAPPTVFGGYYGSGGPCSLGAIATPGIVTVEADSAEPRVDDLTACTFGTSGSTDYPASAITTPTPSMPIQGPVTGVVDSTGQWLYVVNRESNNVAVMSTARSGANQIKLVNVGAGPTGIALTNDGKRAYVYNSFDHSLTRIEGSGQGDSATLKPTTIHGIAAEVLPDAVVKGRRLFFSAVDSRMTNPSTGTSCNTCHLDAREDGHTWMFPDGPRQTPSLAGRKLGVTAPYHWSGEFSSMQEFMDHTVTMRMGGSSVTTSMSADIMAYLDHVQPPDNPFKVAVPTAQHVRGAQVFQKAECNACHSGEAFTNNVNADVGTLVRTGAHRDDLKITQLNTPSLLGLARTSPYLHDGSAGSLKDRLMTTKSTNLHGRTADLSDAEMDDLVAYLNTL